MIRTPAGTFELVEDNRDGWNPEAFKERYSDILDKYDFIVGDWGYGQLRLRGFYDTYNRKAPFEQKIATLDEYLHEFCNFGCAYFVLRKVRTEEILVHSEEETIVPALENSSEQQPVEQGQYNNPGGRHNRTRQGRSVIERNNRVQKQSRQIRTEHKDRAGDRNIGERSGRELKGRRAAIEIKAESTNPIDK